MKNYLWSLFSSIRNGQISRKTVIFFERKKNCENFLKILWDGGFILGYKTKGSRFKIFLKYVKNKPVIYSLKPVSKPSRRVYCATKKIWKINFGKALIIFSTNQGLKSLPECKKRNLGGELIVIIN